MPHYTCNNDQLHIRDNSSGAEWGIIRNESQDEMSDDMGSSSILRCLRASQYGLLYYEEAITARLHSLGMGYSIIKI